MNAADFWSAGQCVELKLKIISFIPGYWRLLGTLSKEIGSLSQQLITAEKEEQSKENRMMRSGKTNRSRDFFLLAEDFLRRPDFPTLNLHFKFSYQQSDLVSKMNVPTSRSKQARQVTPPSQRRYTNAMNEDMWQSMQLETVYQKAVRFDCFNAFKYAWNEDKGVTWDVYPSIYAAKCNKKEVLEWIKSAQPLLYSQFLIAHAAKTGNLELCIWLRENFSDLVINDETAEYAAASKTMDVMQWLYDNKLAKFTNVESCTSAAARGNLEILKWLRSLDPPCPWDSLLLTRAVQGNHDNIVRWARSQNPPCPWDEYPLHFAVERGNFELVKWLRAQDPPCPWNSETCVYAARGRNLEMLKWLRSQNPPCPWDHKATEKAAKNNNIPMLEWMRSQDPPCPWDYFCTAEATSNGYEELFDWMMAHDAPLSDYVVKKLSPVWLKKIPEEKLKAVQQKKPPPPPDSDEEDV